MKIKHPTNFKDRLKVIKDSAKHLRLSGKTIREIAEMLNLTESTIKQWHLPNPKLIRERRLRESSLDKRVKIW